MSTTLLLSAPGCVGGDTGTEGLPALCGMRLGQTPLASDASTPYGTLPELVEPMLGERRTAFTWYPEPGEDPVRTTLRFELQVDMHSARQVRRGPGCEDDVELDAFLRFESDDGSFMEVFEGVLHASPVSASGYAPFFEGDLTVAELRGDFSLEDDPGLGPFTLYLHGSQHHEQGERIEWESGGLNLGHADIGGYSRTVGEW